jgi:anti-sigma B factor antagonist
MQVRLDVGNQFKEITGDTADEFAQELLRMEDSDFEEIVLDFDGTEYMNSMAMGSIFATYQKLSEQNRKLKIINVNDKIFRLLRMANLTGILDMSQDEGGEAEA